MKKDKKEQNQKGEVIIYEGRVEVKLQQNSVWLKQDQIAELFGTERSVITKHLSNIYKSGELDEKSNVQKMHIAGSDKPVKFYNLDTIISVGYRVNSSRATKFRVWATNVLRSHLIKGITINQQRIKESRAQQLAELKKALILIETTKNKVLTFDEASGLLEIITNYANTWLLLQKYDEGKLEIGQLTKKVKKTIDYADAQKSIAELKDDLISKKEASDIFGQERGKTLEGILNSINQSFDGRQLYPSLEQKAAHLLYFIIKDHPFVDGNKRIASLLFLVFLARNNHLLNKKSQQKVAPNTLVALALLIAESQPKQKETMIKLIINFLKK
ncbi:MAG: putative Death-on-curing family protein [Parcubacteria group bacterium GW2011_GWA2_43_9b]|uniref:Fido domain-containing protein n=1 Tax=Candidatus Portnoybacteria bacterium RIFCSPLOWO2_02_FULL_39_11 TaxID=1802001 RepID=A0A1G2FXP9_9BACT|nr:MAG: putative Death-on-curing family protein [Parcubacteria group bacterium GW2011_GWA2_43_9b]OGZ42390.1 MAG: hypothetical protein A3B04_00510 [Candidatus Portnoybacteria bacterium RIFCSPLOWO2_02_FULL_39_11]